MPVDVSEGGDFVKPAFGTLPAAARDGFIQNLVVFVHQDKRFQSRESARQDVAGKEHSLRRHRDVGRE